MEAEIIPMCEDQGMAVVPWAALGGGQLLSAEQRKQNEQDPGARKSRGSDENDVKVSKVLERIAESKSTTLQATVCPMVGLKDSLLIADNLNRLWHISSSNQLTSSRSLVCRPSSTSRRCPKPYA
jgi:hypothetical protein